MTTAVMTPVQATAAAGLKDRQPKAVPQAVSQNAGQMQALQTVQHEVAWMAMMQQACLNQAFVLAQAQLQVQQAAMMAQTLQQPAEEEPSKQRYKAVVTRIGGNPMLSIDSLGEFRFAYRSVKKNPGETGPRAFLQVGDEVECRLTERQPVKAFSIKVMRQVASTPPELEEAPESDSENDTVSS